MHLVPLKANEMGYGRGIENRSATSGSVELYADLRNYLDVLSGEGHHILVSCRTQDVEGDLGLVSRAKVKVLDASKVKEFLTKYCPGEGASAFQSLTEKGLLELYQNPYRLSLLVEELEDGAIPNVSFPSRASRRVSRAKREC